MSTTIRAFLSAEIDQGVGDFILLRCRICDPEALEQPPTYQGFSFSRSLAKQLARQIRGVWGDTKAMEHLPIHLAQSHQLNNKRVQAYRVDEAARAVLLETIATGADEPKQWCLLLDPPGRATYLADRLEMALET